MTRSAVNRLFRVVASAVLTVALLSLSLAGCTSLPTVDEALKAGANQPTVGAGTTLEQGVLTVGINASNAPYSWKVTTGNQTKLQGIDIDAALAMAEEMGLTVKFVNTGTNYDAAANGLCDVVMGATAAQVPASEVLVGNYLEAAPAVFGKNVASVVTVEQLAAATVGVQADSVSARAVAAMAPTAQLTSFSTLNDAFAALEAGTVQYVACDSLMGGYLASGYPSISLAGALALPDLRGVAVPASNVALQSAVLSALDAITSNGELAVIRADWVGSLPAITTANQVVATTPAPEPAVEGDVPVEGV